MSLVTHPSSYRTLIGLLVLLGIVIPTPSAYQRARAQSPQIRLGSTVQGTISENSPSQSWQIQLADGDTLSLLVNRLAGDLDPMVTLIDPNDEELRTNDDLVGGMIYDAGLENIAITIGGIYTIKVEGTSGAGDYKLRVYPAYTRVWEDEDFSSSIARWQEGRFTTLQDDQLLLDAEPEFSVYVEPNGSVPLENFYLQAEFTWISDPSDVNATAGFLFRTDNDETRRPPGYYFLIKPNGTWSVLVRNLDEFTVLQTDTPNPALEADHIILGVWAFNSRLRFYANGQLLGELDDNTFSSGTVGFHIRGATASARVAIDNLLLTVPQVRMPNFPSQLITWQSRQPNDTIAELQRVNVLPDQGRRDYFLERINYDTGPRQIRVFTQQTPSQTYQNLVIGADVYAISGDNIGCGLTFHYLDEGNQTLVFIDSDNGAGLVFTRNGIIQSNTYDFLPTDAPNLETGRTRLLLIAQGDAVALYVNGLLFTRTIIPPNIGTIGTALVNYSTTGAACGYENFWIWQ